jgi:hypothetical protein
MALTITNRTRQALSKVGIEPQLILEIDGVPTIYTATIIKTIIRVGDPGLVIGDDWQIGGFRTYEDQSDTISLSVTTTEISQQLNPERGAISSISSMKVSLVDVADKATELISPGFVVPDILGRRARLYIGFKGTSFPDDFIPVFRGIIDDVESQQVSISLNIAHPDQKKRNSIFQRGQTALTADFLISDTTITVASTQDFLGPVLGPDGTQDPSLSFYVRIGDEIIKYTGKTSTEFTGCTRAQFGTIEVNHTTGDDVVSIYQLEGNGVDLALKIMFSGRQGPYEEGLQATSFVKISDSLSVPNAIFFGNINLSERYGVVEGDFVTTTMANDPTNDVTLLEIESIVRVEEGTYIVVDSAGFVLEDSTPAVVDFRSQYDTLPSGLKMHGDEVDVEQHLIWKRRYLSGFDYDFRLKDTVEAKSFIEKELYLPMGAYSLPRKSKASMGFTAGPIPTATIQILDNTNIINAKDLKIRRSIGKNFYNTIIYKFDQDVFDDRYLSGWVESDATSQSQIPVGSKALLIESKGMRRAIGGATQANLVATRLLTRYAFAAEFMDNIKVLFDEGITIEPGDIILFDGSKLNISDIKLGVRGRQPRLMEVVNKRMNIRTGETTLSIVDSGFAIDARYALMGPSSIIIGGASETTFTIAASFGKNYGASEFRKWENYIGCAVMVRAPDFSQSAIAILVSASSNTITVDTPLGFTPTMGYIMDLAEYNEQPEIIKLLYGFMTDQPAFDDGEEPYVMS